MKNLEFRMLNAECRLQNADCRLQNADCRLQNADCRLQNADCRLQNADCRLQNADCRLKVTGRYGFSSRLWRINDSFPPRLRRINDSFPPRLRRINDSFPPRLRGGARGGVQPLVSFKSTIFSLLFLITIFLTFSFAHSAPLGGQAGSFLRMSISADLAALGGCGAALTGYGMNWHYNPASLGFQSLRQATLGCRILSLDRSVVYIDYSFPLKGNAVLGFGFLRAATTDIDGRDSNGERFDILSNSDNLIHGTFSICPHQDIALGVSLKWMINNTPHLQADDKSLNAYGMGIDLGFQFRASGDLRFGFQLRDLNAKYGWETSKVWGDDAGAKDDNFPTLIRLGGAWNPLDDLTLTSDVVLHKQELGRSSDAAQPHFGAEWRYEMKPGLGGALRGGYDRDNPTFGFSLDFVLRWNIKARFDYAFVMEQVSPGGSNIIGWKFSF